MRGRGAGVTATSAESGGIECSGDGGRGRARRLEVARRGAEIQLVDLDTAGQGLAPRVGQAPLQFHRRKPLSGGPAARGRPRVPDSEHA